MAQKASKDKGTRNLLIGGLVCILLSIGLFAYELLRPLTADEIKALKDQQRIDAEIAKKNAPRTAP